MRASSALLPWECRPRRGWAGVLALDPEVAPVLERHVEVVHRVDVQPFDVGDVRVAPQELFQVVFRNATADGYGKSVASPNYVVCTKPRPEATEG